MPAKKTTSRTRSTTTKRTKTARATTAKRATKAKASAKPEPVDPVPAVEIAEVAAPEAAAPEVEASEHAAAPVPAPAYTPMLTRVPRQTRVPTEPRVAPEAPPSRGGDRRPSRFTGEAYLHATGPSERPVRRPGNWLIFVSRSRVDALWETVRRAVESGRLGHAAKVSTAVPNPLSPDPKKHVICVYTADENDPADVRRVRAALRQIGITWKIPYKSDATMRAAATKYFE